MPRMVLIRRPRRRRCDIEQPNPIGVMVIHCLSLDVLC
jgi:hypothetical protein